MNEKIMNEIKNKEHRDWTDEQWELIGNTLPEGEVYLDDGRTLVSTKMTSEDGNSWTFFYLNNKKEVLVELKKLEDRLYDWKEFVYDEKHNCIAKTSSLGTTKFKHDELGNIIETRYPTGSWMKETFDKYTGEEESFASSDGTWWIQRSDEYGCLVAAGSNKQRFHIEGEDVSEEEFNLFIKKFDEEREAKNQ